MPLFALIGRDGPASAASRQTHRPAHLAKLQELDAQRRIRYAGPLLDDGGNVVGSLILFEAVDLSTARRFAASDPYVVHGVFESFEVYETRATLPKSID